jgi:hypothetical protein
LKPAPGAAGARVVSAEFLDQFGIDADDAVAALDLGLARGNPLRRLLVGSKGRLGVVVAVHGCLPHRAVDRASIEITITARDRFMTHR